MMKKCIALFVGATLVGGVLFAQNRVIGVHPAHDGKLLTMEEAVVGRLSPENRYYSWVNDNQFGVMNGRQMEMFSIGKNGELTAVEAASAAMPVPGRPGGRPG